MAKKVPVTLTPKLDVVPSGIDVVGIFSAFVPSFVNASPASSEKGRLVSRHQRGILLNVSVLLEYYSSLQWNSDLTVL